MSLVDLRRLTSDEAASLDEDAVGVVQIGAIEQHGPHLPLGTDAFITEALVSAVAEMVPTQVVAAPPIFPGRSDHHLGFAGTISLPAEVLDGLLIAYVSMLCGLGLSKVMLFSAHGGNFGALASFAGAYRGPATVRAYDDFRRFLDVMARAGSEAGLDAPATDSHAGAYETSLVLALNGPEAVRDFSSVEGYTAGEDGWLARLQRGRIENLSPSGVIGRPAGASADVGARILDALAAELADWLTRTFARSTPADAGSRR